MTVLVGRLAAVAVEGIESEQVALVRNMCGLSAGMGTAQRCDCTVCSVVVKMCV
jgi:hypothetical protein